MINIIQIGLGPLGQQVVRYFVERSGIQITGIVDINPELHQQDGGEISGSGKIGVLVSKSLDEALATTKYKPQVAVITTVSSIKNLVPQVEDVAKSGLHIVSTCEELSFPWQQHPMKAAKIDDICKKNNVSCLGTGVNPGYLMDYLPSVITSINQRVDSIEIERIQDALKRRVPFQKKIGAGLTVKEFQVKKENGVLKHVGLPESIDMIAYAMGWELDNVDETLEPILAENKIVNGYKPIEKGETAGVQQVATGFSNGKQLLKLVFRAAVDEPTSYDRINVKGLPDIGLNIDGGVNGDIATCAITVNATRAILSCKPGLNTMLDIPTPAWFSK